MTSVGLDATELARELVRTPSPNPPGDERAVADVVERALAACGLPPARRVERASHRPNLLTTVEFGPGGRHLVLSGHLDTKPVGDAAWSRDPYDARVDGDRLYGLGSADMKAAVAAMIIAAARLVGQPGGPARGRLSLLFTGDEEDGAAFGSRHVAESVPLAADAVVIGEPGGLDADFDRLHLVSRGIARLLVTARGTQGHSSLSDRPGMRNAGVDAARAVVALADLALVPTPPNSYGLPDWRPTLNTALAFHGGVGYGVLPGRVDVATEVRLLPGMTRENVLNSLREALVPLGDGELGVEFATDGPDWLPATVVEPTHPVAAAARAACRDILGSVPQDGVFPGTTDATWFASAQHLPTLPAFGPGLLRRAHGADEWVSRTAIDQSVELYAALARRFCEGAPP